MGNDINDIDCFSLVHCAVVPADANKMAKSNADIILSHNGGFGAVRELCENDIRR
jgi:3-deoxy-D-manno-octulosonate 8-phosphate phosphatase KdsC-like HAD superfamily phosphatase